MLSLIDFYLAYQNIRTNAPPEFGLHLMIQTLGHSLGRDSICAIQPRAVNMNTYLGLFGPSGKGRKTTSQETIMMPLVPLEYRGTSNYSPEGLLSSLSEQPQLLAPLGEFSTFLRGIKVGGNMANFKEITNDLYGCPEYYTKRLSKMANSYDIENCYLSMSTTCTEEEFFPNLTPDMVHGGFLPRWITVKGTTKHRKRVLLPDNIDKIEEFFQKLISACYLFYSANPVRFVLEDRALDSYDEICKTFEESEQWRNMQAFVSRYENHIIKYACILRISDLIGNKLSDFTNLTNLTNFTELTIDNLGELINVDNSVNSVNSVIPYSKDAIIPISESYIKLAYKLLLPCLKYAEHITNYVNEDLSVAKIMYQCDRLGTPIERSKLMRNSKLTSAPFKTGLETLLSRKQLMLIKRITIVRGRTNTIRTYCTTKGLPKPECKKCVFKKNNLCPAFLAEE